MSRAPKKKVRSKKPRRQTVAPARNLPETFPIVAIGASAGGLEAFSNLLRSLPAEPGIALIFTPHLDPTHESVGFRLSGMPWRALGTERREDGAVPLPCRTLLWDREEHWQPCRPRKQLAMASSSSHHPFD